jgi:hypothetical protein
MPLLMTILSDTIAASLLKIRSFLKSLSVSAVRILLKADEGPDGPAWTDAMISSALDGAMSTVARVRQTAVQEGLDAALQRKLPKRVYLRTLLTPSSPVPAATAGVRSALRRN